MKNNTDDVITLNGDIQWLFPKDMDHCPECGSGIMAFARPNLIAHYQKNHAMFTVLCHLCNQPICTQKDPNNFIKHYKLMHPDAEPPTDPDETVSVSMGTA